MPTPDDPARTHVGELIRRWRRLRGMSQEALADHTGISTRHLSFVETGRAAPSREMVDWLGQALRVPPEEHHTLVEAAGFFAGYDPRAAGDGRLGQVVADVQRIVDSAEGRPMVVHDIYGTLIAWNACFEAVVRQFVDFDAFRIPSGGHALIAALQPHLVQGADLSRLYVRRVYDEALRGKGDIGANLQQLLGKLVAALPSAGEAERAFDPRERPPLLARVTFAQAPLDFDGFTATLGTPPDAHLRTLRMLTLLPRDEATEAAIRAYVGAR